MVAAVLSDETGGYGSQEFESGLYISRTLEIIKMMLSDFYKVSIYE